ncbi:hypothetical protein SAMN05216298_3186 [Glycomyces sambucus]|uniref:Tryptophan-associated transmembrane protein (Trp_oprn_chp) n=1 Tax=Glycomyces sambucus TaxID=380244 RepID=A0A1G9IDI3_9ACTN|nr:DUF6463 family protein [Glycomyces sambucus]SDL23291.1 hypothetical protein SAMN05216298_3186 [Glycomyces sambucus]
MTKWAGWIFTVLGALHLVLGFALLAPRHAGAWAGGDLWLPEGTLAEMSPASGAFWMTFGSFGAPLLALGLTVLWLERRGIVPPAFLAWIVGAWSVAAGLVFEPAPWIAATIGAVLLGAGTRKGYKATVVNSDSQGGPHV